MKRAVFSVLLIGCLSWGCDNSKDQPGNEGGSSSTAGSSNVPSAGAAGTLDEPGGGGEDSGGNASGGHSSSGGSHSVGGNAGGGNAGGDAVLCPATPLASGSQCSAQGQCTYLDCSGAGQVTVNCNGSGSTASVETLPCGLVRCGGIVDCAAGEVCVIDAGTGMQNAKCVANPCAGRAVGCDCIGSLCGGRSCVAHGTVLICAA